MKLVRIHPHNPKQGYMAKIHLSHGSGYGKFVVGTWYEVDDSMAERLAGKLNNPHDPYSKPVFQVCDQEEYKALVFIESEQSAKTKSPVPIFQAKVHKPERPKLPAMKPKISPTPVISEEPAPTEDWNLEAPELPKESVATADLPKPEGRVKKTAKKRK